MRSVRLVAERCEFSGRWLVGGRTGTNRSAADCAVREVHEGNFWIFRLVPRPSFQNVPARPPPAPLLFWQVFCILLSGFTTKICEWMGVLAGRMREGGRAAYALT